MDGACLGRQREAQRMITRRDLIESLGAGAGVALLGTPGGTTAKAGVAPDLSPLLPEGTRAEASVQSLPGKKPLIKLTTRPPNYEAPIDYLRSAITPNDEFFLRYHLPDIPEVDGKKWKLRVGGATAKGERELDLEELKKLPAAEVVAVCQCAGNRRGLFQPHVAGIEWGNGAMGCARWKGARLEDVLDLVGVGKDAVEVVFNGTDGPVVADAPDFSKSLPVAKALEKPVLVAYEMNGHPLPHWNGFPARLVVPGWSATYWVKHLGSIDRRRQDVGRGGARRGPRSLRVSDLSARLQGRRDGTPRVSRARPTGSGRPRPPSRSPIRRAIITMSCNP